MKTGTATLGAAALLLATCGAVQAQGLKEWGFASGWHIMVDPALGNGCLIQTAYDNDTFIRIGLDATQKKGYVTVFDPKWGDIEDGASYPVTFDLDGEKFESVAKGFHLNKIPGAGIFFDDRNFIYAIAQKQVMTIYGQSGKILAIELGGSAVALEGARKCQAEQG